MHDVVQEYEQLWTIEREHAAELKMLQQRYALLTPREREVFTLVISGLLNKQVGAELGMTEATVKAHRGQVMQKMKARSIVSAPGCNVW